jgi:hypothetical protein
MKHLWWIPALLCLLSVRPACGQQRLRMRPADRLLVEVFTDHWRGLPEGMETGNLNRGVSIRMMHDEPLGMSPFSLAVGLGFFGHNLYSGHLYRKNGFQPITGPYDHNKISLNYLGLPLEVRIRSGRAGQGFRLSAGLSAKWLVNAHTKFEGPGLHYGAPGQVVRIKEHRLGGISRWTWQYSLRAGWGRYGLSLGWSPGPVFEGPQESAMRPLSLGVSIRLY